MKKRVLSLLMSFVMLLSLLPATIRAAETNADDVSVTFRFDCRSIATNDMLTACEISYPTSQTVTVPRGSSVYAALQKLTGYTVTCNDNNSMVTSFADIGPIGTLCDSLGAAYSENFQYAGWMYSGEHVDGLGIQTDTLDADDTITFRYTVYYGAKSQTEWVNFDWDLVDAYYGIQEDITGAKALDQNTDNYTAEQWAALQSAITAAESALSAVQTADENGYLSGGLMLNYIASKGTALWGTGSPTDQLQTARAKLKKAVNKVVAPTGVSVPTDTIEIPMGTTYQINATVLPEGAPQGVTYEAFVGDSNFDLSAGGLITPKSTASLCMIQVKSVEDPTKFSYFKFKIVEAPQPTADADKLLENIAKSYQENTGEWYVMDMGAYAALCPTGAKLTESAKQSYINKTIQALCAERVTDTTYAKSILALTAIGADVQQLYPVNSNTPINAIAALNGVTQSTSAWSAPYTLAAYNQRSYTGTESYERALINALLENQGEDGSWDEWGTIDTTANVIAGLSFYADETAVKTAIDKGVAYLAAQMQDSGAYDGGYGANANSTAMVIIGLAAAGVNPDTDSRFIKNGVSVLDGLLSFALTDNSGFGYQDNTTYNTGATEQAFRALIAAKQVMTTGKAYNIYDFSANSVSPARATSSGAASTLSVPTGNNITVRVTIKADTGYWLNSKSVTIAGEGATVYHAFTAALEGTGITQVGAANGYVSSMTKDGRELAEFTNGENSGWLYKVNGTLPTVGLTSQAVSSGDSIVFYYTNDWTLDPSAGSMGGTKQPEASSSLTPSVTVSNGAASAQISAAALDSALKAAEKEGESAVTIAPRLRGTAATVTVSLPLSAAASAAQQGVGLVIDTGAAQVVLDTEVLAALSENDGTALTVEISTESSANLSGALSPDQLAGAVIAQVTVTAGGDKVTSFGGRALAVELPVSGDAFRSGARVRVYLFSDDGSVERTEGLCIEKDGKLVVRVETTHLSTFVVLPETALPFADVDEAAWYADAVRYAYDHELMTGVADDRFDPDGTATRAQLVTILHRLAGSPAVDYLMQFSDVDEDVWYTEAVRWAASEGIVTGYTDGRFDPNGVFTREQLAAILYRYVCAQGGGFTGMWYFPLRYEDAGAISPWADEAMHWCVMRGILTGTSTTTLEPASSATRAQLAAVLQRFCTRDADETLSPAERAYQGASAYLAKTVSAPTVASIGGEWTVLALSRGGADFDPAAYLASLEKTLQETNGVLSSRKYTEYSRVILALSALGEDARNVAGYDLTAPLGDYDKMVAQGVNGAIFALLALDCADYPMPCNAEAATPATRQMYVDCILSAQRADGGWSLKADAARADPDLTAMALQALSKYQQHSSVSKAINAALVCLSALQNSDGGFSSSGTANAESCAQVLLALSELGIDSDDSRFVKSGCTALDALLTYQTADGGFCHTADGGTNLMATEQAACALAALVRAQNGQSSFYRMNETAAATAAA